MTVGACTKYCLGRGWKFAGVEYGYDDAYLMVVMFVHVSANAFVVRNAIAETGLWRTGLHRRANAT